MATESREAESRDAVARYYDRNTPRFLALGGGAASQSIHRALWGPGVTSHAAAADYVNRLIGDAIEALVLEDNATVLDFGCGVGGTLFALARRFPGLGLHGVTISRRQAELAGRFAAAQGLAANCSFFCGDFESADFDVTADVAIAVESMVHARSPTAFLASVARQLKTGGTLLVVDDFIARSEESAEARAVLRDFRAGWRLSSLTSIPDFVAAAEAAGFAPDESRDLTPLIRLRRPRDRAIAVVGPLMRGLVNMPTFGNFVGGAALNRGLRSGVLEYRWLRLQR